MVTQIWSRIHPSTIRSKFAVTGVEGFPVAGPAPRIEPSPSRTGAHGPLRGLTGLLARWRARIRSRAELDALTDATRADLGLAPKPPRWQDELRFIAQPDRFGIINPGLWG